VKKTARAWNVISGRLCRVNFNQSGRWKRSSRSLFILKKIISLKPCGWSDKNGVGPWFFVDGYIQKIDRWRRSSTVVFWEIGKIIDYSIGSDCRRCRFSCSASGNDLYLNHLSHWISRLAQAIKTCFNDVRTQSWNMLTSWVRSYKCIFSRTI
jgi:hypothetical protein